MKKKVYEEQIAALTKACEYCKKGGASEVVPMLNQRIRWMKENDYEL